MSHQKLKQISYPTRRFFLFATVPMLITLLLFLSVNQVFAHQYFNCAGTEPTINGNSNTLMCDDFEDGNWYVTNADTSGGKSNLANAGWAGNIFAPTDAQGYGRCGSIGAVGTNCSATSGNRSGSKAEAWHWFAPSAGDVNELYHRFYTQFRPGYNFGHEKLVFYQHDETTNGQVGILMTPFGSGTFDFQTQVPDDSRYGQNQGNNLTFIPGRWYYVEVRVKLDTPQGSGNGVIQVWADDCGTNGLGCTGSGTLRLSHSGRNIRPSSSLGLGVIWQENWSNSTTMTASGEVYNDQVVVSKSRIGPMRATAGGNLTPPQAPAGLQVTQN